MREDLAPTKIYLTGVLPNLTQNQFDALCSLIFNIGLRAFEKSTLLKRLRAGDTVRAAERLMFQGGCDMARKKRRHDVLFYGVPVPLAGAWIETQTSSTSTSQRERRTPCECMD